MLLSYSHRFIFIHIAKTGGLSVRDILEKYSEEPEKFKIKRPLKLINEKHNIFYDVWRSLLLHATAQDALNELPADVFNNAFKFAFVRNPWDWQVSMYHFILREPKSTPHNLVKSFGSFDAYIKAVVGTDFRFPKGTTKFQYEMIVDDNGKLLVDFIGHYETLAADFEHICRVIGINESLPHLNRSEHRDYRSYYTEETRQLIAEHYAKDIALFGYTFDGLIDSEQAMTEKRVEL